MSQIITLYQIITWHTIYQADYLGTLFNPLFILISKQQYRKLPEVALTQNDLYSIFYHHTVVL